MIKINHKLKQSLNVIFCFILLITLSVSSFSQSIRKDYREFTNAERLAYIGAINALWDGGAAGNSFVTNANLHATLFNSIHFSYSSPQFPFLPWHREFIRRFEIELRNTGTNSNLAIPYWNWTEDNLKSSALWGSDWLGPYDDSGDPNYMTLLRSATTSITLAIPSDLQTDVLALTTYASFTGTLEFSPFHNRAHGWVAGAMNDLDSPRDPVFMFNHGFIDKIWQNWFDDGNQTAQQNFDHTDTFMPGFSTVDPDDITDSRVLDIWYASNNLVVLDKHTVFTGSPRIYKYVTGVIQAENNFVVPSGADCTFEANIAYEIAMLPGFGVEQGSEFAAIVTNAVMKMGGSTNGASDNQDTVISDQTNYSQENNVEINQNLDLLEYQIDIYPNPFFTTTKIEYSIANRNSLVNLEVFNLQGQKVASLVNNLIREPGIYQVMFNGSFLSGGIYFYKFKTADFIETGKLILAK